MPVIREHLHHYGDDNNTRTASALVNASLLANASMSMNQGPIKNIPEEMISEIMSYLSPCFAASFGLTCTKVYAEFKHKHSKPLKLETLLWDTEDESINSADREKKLHHLIGGWINKDRQYFYHQMHLFPNWQEKLAGIRPPTSNYVTQSRQCVGGRFLLTELYAPSSFVLPSSRIQPPTPYSASQKNLARLREAYEVYTELVQEDEEKYPRLVPRHEFAAPIPSPCNMGDDWFLVFFNCLVTDWNLTSPVGIIFDGDLYYILQEIKVNRQGGCIMIPGFCSRTDRYNVGNGTIYVKDFIAKVRDVHQPPDNNGVDATVLDQII
ncbi:hypothetical protein NHQ30_011201 [Ciborinia camelliae]|nr:hypothetical protein NHQ30_011201 [Ciborinia camelliae]